MRNWLVLEEFLSEISSSTIPIWLFAGGAERLFGRINILSEPNRQSLRPQAGTVHA